MSARVYLSTHTGPITHEEEIPVCIRIQLSRTTVKDLHSRLQHAYQRADVRSVQRITVVLDLLVHWVPMAVLCERWGLSPSYLHAWQQKGLLPGMESLVYGHRRGRPPKLTPQPKKRLGRVPRGCG
jgi:hypothetical protein